MTRDHILANQNLQALSDTRLQLHWAVQLLGAAGDAMLEHAKDESHRNLGWDGEKQTLVGRSGSSFDVSKFELGFKDHSLTLSGVTLEEGRRWLSEKTESELNLPDYEMPEHPVASGAEFTPDSNQLQAIADWFTLANDLLTGWSESRLWPHHFDLGFLLTGIGDGNSIGGGFTIGDSFYDRPYFYINPYGVERPKHLPDVAPGFWTDSWFGAVLTSDEMADGENVETTINKFITSTIDKCKTLIDQG